MRSLLTRDSFSTESPALLSRSLTLRQGSQSLSHSHIAHDRTKPRKSMRKRAHIHIGHARRMAVLARHKRMGMAHSSRGPGCGCGAHCLSAYPSFSIASCIASPSFWSIAPCPCPCPCPSHVCILAHVRDHSSTELLTCTVERLDSSIHNRPPPVTAPRASVRHRIFSPIDPAH